MPRTAHWASQWFWKYNYQAFNIEGARGRERYKVGAGLDISSGGQVAGFGTGSKT